MLNPEEAYNRRMRVSYAGTSIKDIMDIGIYLWFNNGEDPNFRYIINNNIHILEYPIIPIKQIPCGCDHVHHITNDNSITYGIYDDIISENDITVKAQKLIEFIKEKAETSDYIIINKRYDIGDKVINFGCPICGQSFTLLPHKITNFDEIEFYKNFDEQRYYHLSKDPNAHFMYALLESLAYHRIMNIPNTTSIIEMSNSNISIFGDDKYEYFDSIYKKQQFLKNE